MQNLLAVLVIVCNTVAQRGLSVPRAECNFAAPESHEMPDALLVAPFCHYLLPSFLLPLLIATQGGSPSL